MARTSHNDVLDAGLNYVKNNTDKWCLCSQAATSFDEANNLPTDVPAGYKLAEVARAPGDFTGPADYAGAEAGRKLTCNQANGVTILATGTGTHYALIDTVNSKLLEVVPTGSTDVVQGEQRVFEAFDLVDGDPVALA